MPTAQEYTELSEQITKYVRIAMTYARKNPNSHAVPMEKDVTNILLNLITLHTQKAEIQTIMNLSAQWVQERITHCLDTPAEDWKTELDHYDEFVAKFIAYLTNPTKGEL